MQKLVRWERVKIRQALWHTVVLGRLLEVVVYVSHMCISVMRFRQLVKGKCFFGNSFGCSSPWPLALSFHSITRQGHGLTDSFSHAPVTKTTTVVVLCLKVPTLFLESSGLKTKCLVFFKAQVLEGQSKLGHSMIPSRWLLKSLNDEAAKVSLEGITPGRWLEQLGVAVRVAYAQNMV